MQRLFERRIQRNVPAPELLIDDRSDLATPGIFGERASLITNLRGQADPHRPMPFLRRAHPGTDVVAHPFPTCAWLKAAENIKPGLEPGREAVRDFDRFMQRMIRRVN